MAIINQHINEFLDYYLNLNEPQYAVLLSGKWGSGKTHFIKQFKEKNKSNYKFIHVSLFGLRSKEDIHKQVIFKLFGLEDDNLVKATDFIGKFIKGILNKYAGVNIALSDIPIDVALKRETNKKVIFIFDDLERIDTGLSEVLGYLNVLVEELGQSVILLANEDEIKDRSFYDTFKEKTIGKTFQIEQDFETAFETFLEKLKNSKEILQNNQSNIKTVFDTAGFKNLRSLRQGILDFDRLIDSFEEKFKTHHELMKEFIQIFFAFTFEIKNGKHNIPVLEMSPKEQMNKILADEDEQKPFIDHIVEEYYLNDSVLPNYLWIKLYSNQYLTKEEVSECLKKNRYFFREERKEWINLWNFRELEEEEFQEALKSTLEKLEQNEYLDPEIVMHITGILLRLSVNRLYQNTEAEILQTMKIYIDRNRKNWDDIYTVDDFCIQQSAFGLGYQSEETDEFEEVKNYLLVKAKETIFEDLPQQGEKLLKSLQVNNISLFQEMLSENRNSILYRLPVFQNINSKSFVDILYHVENKYFRYMSNILIMRYDKIGWEEYSPLFEELDFWKKVYKIINNDIQAKQVSIKMTWLKLFNENIEKKIIQKIENEIERKKKIEQLAVTENE